MSNLNPMAELAKRAIIVRPPTTEGFDDIVPDDNLSENTPLTPTPEEGTMTELEEATAHA